MRAFLLFPCVLFASCKMADPHIHVGQGQVLYEIQVQVNDSVLHAPSVLTNLGESASLSVDGLHIQIDPFGAITASVPVMNGETKVAHPQLQLDAGETTSLKVTGEDGETYDLTISSKRRMF